MTADISRMGFLVGAAASATLVGAGGCATMTASTVHLCKRHRLRLAEL